MSGYSLKNLVNGTRFKAWILIVFVMSFLSCSQEKTAEKDLKDIAREVMISSKNCALITIDSLGFPKARAMDPFSPEENFTVWMATNPRSSKVKDISRNNRVTLYYFDKDDPGYVSIQGIADLVNDEEVKQKFWKEEWENFYKNRTDDYLLIKVSPLKIHVISEKFNVLGDSITWAAPKLKLE